MILELPIRWTEDNEDNEENLKEILGSKAKLEKKFTYGRLLIDSDKIGPYYDIDENHTMINDSLGKMYCVVIPLNHFKKIMTEVTGDAIMSIQLKEDVSSRSNRRPDNSEDDIFKK